MENARRDDREAVGGRRSRRTGGDRAGGPPGYLLCRIRGGERGEFERLYKRHHQEIYRYCLAVVRNREDAEDALQATMAAALRSLPGEEARHRAAAVAAPRRAQRVDHGDPQAAGRTGARRGIRSGRRFIAERGPG